MRRVRYPGDWVVVIFCGLFVLGILFAFFLVKGMREYFLHHAGLLSDYYFRQMKYREFDGNRLFPYFLGKRMKWVALFLSLSFLHVVLWVAAAFAFWMGFSFGFLLGIGVLKFGGAGILVGMLLILPQGIFYLWGALGLFRALREWESAGGYWQAFPGRKVLLGVLILFLGILTESYVNPWCFKLIFRLV